MTYRTVTAVARRRHRRDRALGPSPGDSWLDARRAMFTLRSEMWRIVVGRARRRLTAAKAAAICLASNGRAKVR